MTEKRIGLQTAIELTGPGSLPAADGVQADMFEADAPLPMPPAKGVSGPKGGRPPGARNKRTDDWVNYLLGKYRSPLVFLLETFHRTPSELAEQLQLYKFHEGKLQLDPRTGQPILATGEAADIQIKAAIAALPYLHQRLPQELALTGDKRGVLVLGDLRIEGGDMGLALPLADDEENQPLTIEHEPKSDGEKSDGGANVLEYKDD